jgi:DNA modification methylase
MGRRGGRRVSDWALYTGDCLNVLPTLPDASVDTVITDPPAGISFMNLPFDSDRGGRLKWVEWLASALRECLRVAKPGATAAVWALPRTSHWTGCALEEAGWEIFDVVTHLFGQGFPKSLDIGKAIDRAAGAEREVVGVRPGHEKFIDRTDHPLNGGWDRPWASDPEAVKRYHSLTAPATDAARLWDGWHSQLKPAAEFWWLARKPLDGTYAHNALAHGVAGLNVNGCRIGTGEDKGNWPVTARDDDHQDWRLRNGNVPTDRTVGRYPANVVLDEEAARLLNEQTGERKSGGMMHDRSPRIGRCYGDDLTPGTRGVRRGPDAGGPSRFFTRLHYCGKASQRERGEGNYFPCVKPLALMRWLCRLTKTPTGGVVLDPFAGSGTTLLAALLEGRRAIGVEVNEGYAAVARKRLAEAEGPLFAHVEGER